MDNEIDECVPGPMAEREPLCSEECSSSGCTSLLTGPWSSASLGEGEEEEGFGFESPEFISGC